MRSFLAVSLLFLTFLCCFTTRSVGQCSSYPVPFNYRVSNSMHIVLGKVIEKHCYQDASTGNINTLNKFRVTAWLKNYKAVEDIYIITLGGVLGNRAMQVNPALQVDMDHEYLLMLEPDNHTIDDKQFRLQNPQALQFLNYADAQGSLTKEGDYYHDLYYPKPRPETALFEEIRNLTGQAAKRPSGETYSARPLTPPVNNGTAAISGFTPTTTNAGTIVTADRVTISGSGFGAASGTVFFTNADDGGATFTATGVATDNVSWSDASIVVKPAQRAGTGPINVNGAMTSGTNLTITYSHLNINSSFSGFGSSTRQRYYLVNKNGLGGYTFTYNTAFAANALAKAAFQRSLFLWRCNSYVNWRSAASTTAIAIAVLDGVNVVTFDATLPVGVLGRGTSRFNGSATGGCTTTNTVWWADELDIQFYPDPPTAGFPWEYGPALPGFSEYDFESVASHELGHLHGLGHVISSGDMMHFALANGQTTRLISGATLSGAQAKMSYSTAALCFNPATVTGPMVALTSGNCILAAELIAFNGERKNMVSNRLFWSTAQEFNNRGFFIERSEDGIAFTGIGYVAASGNNLPGNYQFMDNKAGSTAWYYRLRQVDRDGMELISKTIFINAAEGSEPRVWTNETGSKIFVYLQAGNKNSEFSLFNALGQPVFVKQLSLSVNELEVGHLPKGIYYYRLYGKTPPASGKLLLGTP